MKIAMLSSNTALSGKVILLELIENNLAPAAVIIEHFVPREGNPILNFIKFLKKKVKKWGFKYVLKKSFALLAGKIIRTKKLEDITLKAFAIDNGIRLIEVDSFNSLQCRNILLGLRPVICTVSGTRILKKNIFQIPEKGCINFHTGLLPKYRGSDTIIWSLYNNDPVGITIHKIDEKLDAGEVILDKEVIISPTDYYDEIYEKACKLGAEMIVQILSHLDYFLNNSINKYDAAFPTWKKAPEEVTRKVRRMRNGYL